MAHLCQHECIGKLSVKIPSHCLFENAAHLQESANDSVTSPELFVTLQLRSALTRMLAHVHNAAQFVSAT